MTQRAMKWSPLGCTEVVGTIVEALEGTYVVDLGSERSEAKRALGCLLEPVADDLVVVALLDDGRAYVLSVLERQTGGATLSVDGDLGIETTSGSVNISGREGVSIASEKKVTLVSAALDVSVLNAKVMLEKAAILGGRIAAEVQHINTVAESVDRTVGRLVDRIQRAYRTVEETDHLRAENIDHRATKTIKMHAENTVVTSEQLVKLDGSQVHIG